MIEYVSITGGGSPVDFETAILGGRALDGGLYVPNELPKITVEQLRSWQSLNYTDLAFEVLSLFIDRSVISEEELKGLLKKSFEPFFHEEKIPIHQLDSDKSIFVQELFHGPTLSFKDVAMGFVVNLFDFFLQRRGERMTIMAATSGDTGPAAAFACSGKKTMGAWLLYPPDLITEEQVRQMTTITDDNIHAVGVDGCPDGSDDLEQLIADLFADKPFKEALNLSSVNSINWGRIMMQTVHYFQGYLKTVEEVGEKMDFSIPCGAFGNLCAGSLARRMGLPVGNFIVANNENASLRRIFSEGVFLKEQIVTTPSSAIDISVPLNFWRHLYFSTGQKPELIKKWMDEFEVNGRVDFGTEVHQQLSEGFLSTSISNQDTIQTIKFVFDSDGYLLDPHAAVAVTAAQNLKPELTKSKIICLATAHPAKFPDVTMEAIGSMPDQGKHDSIESAKNYCQRIYACSFDDMRLTIPNTMRVLTK